MGQGADDLFDAWLRQEFRDPPDPYQEGGLFMWLDANGDLIDMDDMTNDYLGNCYAKCIKYGDFEKAKEIMIILRDRMNV